MEKSDESRYFASGFLVAVLGAAVWVGFWVDGSVGAPLITAVSCLVSALTLRDERECVLCANSFPALLVAMATAFAAQAVWNGIAAV